MKAIDTNIVVRCFIDHDIEQCTAARRLVDTESVFVATTVMLETEWVLRSVYGFTRHEIAVALIGFSGLPTVVLEHPPRIHAALQALSRGADFADALHLAAAESCEAFYTFDRKLGRQMTGFGMVSIRTP